MKLVVAGLQNNDRADAVASRLKCTKINTGLGTRRCRTFDDLSTLEKNNAPEVTALSWPNSKDLYMLEISHDHFLDPRSPLSIRGSVTMGAPAAL